MKDAQEMKEDIARMIDKVEDAAVIRAIWRILVRTLQKQK